MWMFVVIVVVMMTAFSQIRSSHQVLETPSRQTASQMTSNVQVAPEPKIAKSVETKSDTR